MKTLIGITLLTIVALTLFGFAISVEPYDPSECDDVGGPDCLPEPTLADVTPYPPDPCDDTGRCTWPLIDQ